MSTTRTAPSRKLGRGRENTVEGRTLMTKNVPRKKRQEELVSLPNDRLIRVHGGAGVAPTPKDTGNPGGGGGGPILQSRA
jgi:hypothetical protein